MKTAYSYVRFSTLEQKKGASTGRQIEAAKLWCQQNGFTLSDEQFRDEGKSAFKGKHLSVDGDLTRFISLVRDGRIKPGSVLILESYDRLSRLVMSESVPLFLQIINSGIGLVFTMTFDKSIINKKMVDTNPAVLYSILGEAQRAHSESKIKSERVKDACNRRKQKAIDSGHKSAGWCPPWCEFVNGEYVPNKKSVEIVKRVYVEYLKGNGPFRISNMFNREHLPTLGHRGNKKYVNTTTVWYKKTVRDLLRDKRVYGYAEFLNKENYYPVIIPLDEFRKVQARFSERSQAEPTGGPRENIGNLFTSICRCAHCDSVMSKSTTYKTYKNKRTKYEYLVCDGARSGKKCSYTSMPYELMERAFYATIRDISAAELTGRTNDKETGERLAILNGEFSMNEEKITRLVNTIASDDKAPKSIVTILKQLEDRQIALTQSIQVTESQIHSIRELPTTLKEMIQVWNEADNLLASDNGREVMWQHIRKTVSKIVLDTTGCKDGDGTTINFQTHFKNGQILSTLIYRERPDNDITLIVWQTAQGVVKVYDWSKAINTKIIREFETDSQHTKYVKLINKLRHRKYVQHGI